MSDETLKRPTLGACRWEVVYSVDGTHADILAVLPSGKTTLAENLEVSLAEHFVELHNATLVDLAEAAVERALDGIEGITWWTTSLRSEVAREKARDILRQLYDDGKKAQ